MPFQNGQDKVLSNSAYISIGGVLPIGVDAKAVDGYNPVFRTRLIEDGKDANGNTFYRTELLKFDNQKDAVMKPGVVIATGSTKPGEKNFEFNENASDIDKKFKERIYTVQKRQISQIVKDESTDETTGRASTAYGTKDKSTRQLKKDLKNFGQNSTQENPVESIDKEGINEAKRRANRSGRGRDNYGVLFYPNFIEKSSQDKLKITVLKQSSRLNNATAEKDERVKYGQGGLPLGTTTFRDDGYKSKFKTRKEAEANKNKNKNKNKNLNSNLGVGPTLDNRRRVEFGKRTLGHITLPIPNGVTDTNKVSFGSGTLNPFQVGVAGVALKTLLEGFGAGAKEAGELFKSAAKNPDIKAAAANLITSSLIGVDNNELLARGEGVIVNNNLELLFKGPTLRPFTFQFIFSPRDRGEAVQVQKIIRCFKQSSAVQRTPGGIFLAAPNTYRLQFLNGSAPHKFLPRIKECALLSVSINYMPENSYMTYEDSSMVAYSVNLAFQELEPIFNDDYDQVDMDATGFGQGRGPMSMGSMQDTGGIGF